MTSTAPELLHTWTHRGVRCRLVRVRVGENSRLELEREKPGSDGTDWHVRYSSTEGHDETLDELARLAAALDDATRTWSFDDGQCHTHSWHDREDWYERHPAARAARTRTTEPG